MGSEIEIVISKLMSPDNNIRGEAEKIFNSYKQNAEFFFPSVVQVICQSGEEQIRKLACVLLHRVLGETEIEALYKQVSEASQARVCQELVFALQKEASPLVRTNLDEVVSSLATLLKTIGTEFPNLLQTLLGLVNSQEWQHRESALHIFSQLAEILGEPLKAHFSLLKDVLTKGLSDSVVKVRLAGLDATASFLQVLNEEQERAHFQQLTPLMLGTISEALNAQSEEDARTAIEVFVDLIDIDPVFLRPNLGMAVQAMLQIAQHTGLEDDTKHLALEFLLTLSETKPTMMRKFPKFVDNLLPIILNMMVDIDDDPNWNNAKDDKEEDVEASNSDIGEESLDRITLSLGGKIIVPVIFSILPTMMASPDWKQRHAALMAISIIGEGSNKFLSPNLKEVLNSVTPFFNDPHPRVRWAASNTFGQMSTDFGPEIQNKFHATILPPLISLMDDKENPRVQSHAASAIINFCEPCESAILEPYLDVLLSKLLSLIQINSIIVQEQAITAIAAIADAAEDKFHKYYDTFMPYLKNILVNANGKEYRNLKGKAMECISLIGVAVGKEKFFADAKDVMDIMIRTQSTKLDADDPQISFLLQSWARLCRCLGQDFVPFLPHVMPSLIASAKISPDVAVAADEEDTNREGWDFVTVGDKQIGIHTSGLEEKSTACNMLYCYAADLKEGFFPYVEEVAKILVPLMKFYYHDGVRSAAVTTIPHLLFSASAYLRKNAATGSDLTYLRSLFHFILPTMLESLKDEMDFEILASSVHALNDSLNAIAENILSPEQVDAVLKAVLHLLDDVKDRKLERQEKRNEEDHDEEEEYRIEDETERDDEITSALCETLGFLAKYNKSVFLPLFNQSGLNVVLQLLSPSSKQPERQAALCVFDDLIEFCGSEAYQYYPQFLPIAMEYIFDTHPAVRQAAVYGLGVCAQHGGPQIASYIPDILSRLNQLINSPDARSDAYAIATENAIAAVGKIAQFQASVVDVSQVIPLWFSWLPVTQDTVESKITYNQLFYFIETNNGLIVGPNWEHFAKLLSILGEILETQLIDENIHQKIIALLKQWQQNLSGDVLSRTWSSLNPAHQQKLQRAIQ